MKPFAKLGLLALVLLMLAPAFAAPPQTLVTVTNPYIEIISPTNDYLKANTTYAFQYHLFNSSNGMPFTAKDNISCSFHLYALLGTHQYVQNDLVINNNVYDVGVTVAAGNFTKGFYNVLVQCNTSVVGGAVKQQFEVTNTGIAPATDTMIIFTFIIFLAMTIGMIYCAIMCLKGFTKKEGVTLDWVIANLGIFVAMLIFVWFNNNYFGNTLVADMMNVYIDIGAFTNVLIPFVAYIISITLIQMLNIRKKKEDET